MAWSSLRSISQTENSILKLERLGRQRIYLNVSFAEFNSKLYTNCCLHSHNFMTTGDLFLKAT